MAVARSTILVVDDDQALLKLLQTFLERSSRHRFRFESDSLAAARVLEREPVDVLVTDQKMPGLDGRALAERGRLLQPHIQVIVISGEQPPSGERPFGADWLLTKPFYLPDLLALVDTLCAPRLALVRPAQRTGFSVAT